MDRQTTGERILDAMLRLVSEKGYRGATTRAIAREAGVTEITLFRHFRSKEHLFEEVLNRDGFPGKLRELLSSLEDCPYERWLSAVGVKFFETLQRKKPLIRIIQSEINIWPRKIRALHGKMIEEIFVLLADAFASLQRRGGMRKFSPRLAAHGFLGMIFTYFRIEEIIKGRTVPPREAGRVVDAFVDIVVHGTKRNNP